MKKLARIILLLLAFLLLAACDQAATTGEADKDESVHETLAYPKVSPEESAASDDRMRELAEREARALARENGPECEPIADSEDDADAIGAFNYDPASGAWTDAYGDTVGYSADVDADIFADEACA